MQKFSLKISVIVVVALSLLGCDNQKPSNPSYTSTVTTMMIIPLEPNTVWDKMAADFTFKAHQSNPRVQRFIKQYSREQYYHLIKLSQKSTPYIYHIMQTLEGRGLPKELALIPFIESEYSPTAASNRGAVGLWQLVSMTGKLYGLKQDQWYDGRKDLDAATKVALDHLEFLYNKFDKDWLLALAAYNCGGARVASAIRANKKAGKPTDFWSLTLPQQTQHYVPKLLSLVYLVKNYRNLDIDLAAIPNKPYFDKVILNKQINLEQAAKLAEVDYKEVKGLNAAYRTQVTHPKGPHEILLPIKSVTTFNNNFKLASTVIAVQKPKTATNTTIKAAGTKKAALSVPVASKNSKVHTVNHGDTLHLIASKYSTTVKAIKTKNNLTSDIIRKGQKLSI